MGGQRLPVALRRAARAVARLPRQPDRLGRRALRAARAPRGQPGLDRPRWAVRLLAVAAATRVQLRPPCGLRRGSGHGAAGRLRARHADAARARRALCLGRRCPERVGRPGVHPRVAHQRWPRGHLAGLHARPRVCAAHCRGALDGAIGRRHARHLRSAGAHTVARAAPRAGLHVRAAAGVAGGVPAGGTLRGAQDGVGSGGGHAAVTTAAAAGPAHVPCDQPRGGGDHRRCLWQWPDDGCRVCAHRVERRRRQRRLGRLRALALHARRILPLCVQPHVHLQACALRDAR